MSLKNQLPYIGLEQEDGSLKILSDIIYRKGYWKRPDYEEFAKDGHLNEISCVEVLIGLKNFCIGTYRLVETKYLYIRDRMPTNPTSNKQHSTILRDYYECSEALDIVLKIKDMINNGIKSEKLDFIDHSDPDDPDYEDYIKLAHQLSPFRIYYYYKSSKFLQWAQTNGYKIPSEVKCLLNPSSESARDETESVKQEEHFDAFITSLRISYENDSQINIHLPGKPKVSVTAQSLGFLNETGKTWNDFLRVLQDSPDHLFYSDSSNNDASRQRLKEINNKLLTYFSETYNLSPPDRYKLYKLAREKGPGVYRFNFKIGDDAGPTIKKTKNIKSKIESAIDRFKDNTNHHETKDEILELLTEGIAKKSIDIDEAKKYLNQIGISDNIFT
jgi:hypothetical protein